MAAGSTRGLNVGESACSVGTGQQLLRAWRFRAQYLPGYVAFVPSKPPPPLTPFPAMHMLSWPGPSRSRRWRG